MGGVVPAKSGGGPSAAGVGAGGTVCPDSVVDSDWALLVSSKVVGLDAASTMTAAVDTARASNVIDEHCGSRVVCACRATGLADEDRAFARLRDTGERCRIEVVLRGAAKSRIGEELRASIARREKRFGRADDFAHAPYFFYLLISTLSNMSDNRAGDYLGRRDARFDRQSFSDIKGAELAWTHDWYGPRRGHRGPFRRAGCSNAGQGPCGQLYRVAAVKRRGCC